jgi:PKD repeat protein
VFVTVIWSAPQTFTSTDPGDLIGNLQVGLSSSANVGDNIGMVLDKSGSPVNLSAAGAASSATETIPDLLFSNGTIIKEAPTCDVAPSGHFLLFYKGATSGCSSGNSTPCLPSEAVTFTLLPRSYTLQTCDTITWNFGDGIGVTGNGTVVAVQSHAFSNAGSYTASVTVSNDSGSTTLAIPVSIASAAVCVAVCAATVPAAVLTGDDVVFAGATSASACASVPVFQWSFGDGTVSAATTSSAVTHVYTKPGVYSWTLTVLTDAPTPCLRSGTIVVTAPRRRATR